MFDYYKNNSDDEKKLLFFYQVHHVKTEKYSSESYERYIF